MNSEPKKSWWSFRLWQLFAIVTLLCVYLAYQGRIVHTRQERLKELQSSLGMSVTTAHDYQILVGGHEKLATVPLVRQWLGDEPIQTIGYDNRIIDDAKIREIARLFPEAVVRAEQHHFEPCHPGCFPQGTLVDTPFGPQAIDAIAVGDEVWTISPAGRRISLPVLSIFQTDNRLWLVETSRGTLRTTETQPLCTDLASSVAAGKLQPGDAILCWSADETDDGLVHSAQVLSVKQTDEIVPVVNLVLGQREPFIAAGFLARSKPAEEDRE